MVDKMLTEFYNLLVSLSLLVPGVAVLEIIDRRYGLHLNLAERIVGGFILWTYIFVASTSLAALFLDVRYVFLIFLLTNMLIILYFVCSRILLIRRYNFKNVKIELPILVSLIFILAWGSLFSILALFTSLYPSADAYEIWIPTAKSILQSGKLRSHELYLSKTLIGTIPPAAPLLYGWVMSIVDSYPLYLFLIYYFLSGLSVYLLSRHIFSEKEYALISTISFMFSIVSLTILLSFTLNPDVLLAFYVITSIFYLVKILEGKGRQLDLLLLGMSLSLMMLIKASGLILAYLIMSFLILALRMRAFYKVVLFIGLVLLPFTLNQFRIYYLFNILLVGKLKMILVLTLVLVIFVIKSISRRIIRSYLGIKQLFIMSAPMIPVLAFLLFIALDTKVLIYSIIMDSRQIHIMSEFNELFIEASGLIPDVTTSLIDFDLISLIRLDTLFLNVSVLNIGYLAVLGIIVRYIKKHTDIREQSNVEILYMILIIILMLMVWRPEIFYPQLAYDASYTRRYFYTLMPLISIFTSYGFTFLIRTTINVKNPSILLVIFLSYLSISTIYILIKISLWAPKALISMFNFSQLKWYIAKRIPMMDLLALMGILFVLILMFKGMLRLLESSRNLKLERIAAIVSLIFVVFSLIAAIYTLKAPLSDIISNKTSIRNEFPKPMKEIIKAFENSTNAIIIGCYKQFLTTFTNVKVIDICRYYGYAVFADMFRGADNISIYEILNKTSIFIIYPTSSAATLEQAIFRKYIEKFSSFASILSSVRTKVWNATSKYVIYKILAKDEYNELVRRYAEYFNFEHNPLILSDDNMTNHFVVMPMFKNIVRLDTVKTHTLKGDNCMKILILKYKEFDKPPSIHLFFKQALDFSNYSFVAFYWYGNNSGITIGIRFWSNNHTNQFEFKFVDKWIGWARLIIPLEKFNVFVGSPNWSNIVALQIVFYPPIERNVTFYVDRIVVDSGMIKDIHVIYYREMLYTSITSNDH